MILASGTLTPPSPPRPGQVDAVRMGREAGFLGNAPSLFRIKR